MSLNMMGTIDQTFATGIVEITPAQGGFIDGKYVPANLAATRHLATKQVANSEELKKLPQGGERVTDVARFLINDGSSHSVGSILIDQHGNKYRIFDADNRPERSYCKLLGASRNE